MNNYSEETVVLLHGLFRTQRDMSPLARYLTGYGYSVYQLRVPCTVKTPRECAYRVAAWYQSRQPWKGRVHFAGHSMGGIILRLFLAEYRPQNLGRCVLIGVPNRGSRLAEAACGMLGPFGRLLKGLDSLRPGRVEALLSSCENSIDFGVIAGTGGSELLAPFFEGLHDGRVSVRSAHHAPAEAWLTLPYSHTRMHKKHETAVLIDRYFQTGRFHQ